MAAKRQKREENEQRAFFDWIALWVGSVPELASVYHVPNGLTGALRGIAHGMGARPGVWDICCPLPAEGCTQLFIEMKAPGEGLSFDQRAFRDLLTGYPAPLVARFVVAFCWFEAARAVCDHLGLPSDHPARQGTENKGVAP